MTFTTEEQAILDYAKKNKKTATEAKAALDAYRAQSGANAAPTATEPAQLEAPKASLFERVTGIADKVGDFLGLGATTDVFGRALARTKVGGTVIGANTGPTTPEDRVNIPAPTKSELAGAALQTGVAVASPLIPASLPLKAGLAAGVGAGYAYDIGQDLAEGNSLSETVKPGMGAVGGILGPAAGPLGKAGAKAAGEVVDAVGKVVTRSPVVRGALGTATEYAERVPRFISRRQADIRDAATKAERIASSPAPIGNALKAGVDERIINTIEQADETTRKGYAEVIRLAEESIDKTGTLKTTARPEIVAGEAAAEQYKLIEEQRRKIGKAIGDQAENLSKDALVPMAPAREQLDEILSEAGVIVERSDTGTTALDFSKSGFTKEQRNKINELYDLANEGGDELTPAQIHTKDRLFSQLQREARMDKIGDIRVGDTSLFQTFRDVYSDTLEEIAPEIRSLNRQYRNLSTFTEDIEKTIIGTNKFETNANMDPAEFAQTSLRRLFSEAQSAADFRAIAEEMDAASRALGYAGAKPEDLARFAYEVRKIYPETTPRTGFEGGIRASVGGVVDAVLTAGKADLSDQQKAMRELLTYLNQTD